jgi:hypothetical protein
VREADAEGNRCRALGRIFSTNPVEVLLEGGNNLGDTESAWEGGGGGVAERMRT